MGTGVQATTRAAQAAPDAHRQGVHGSWAPATPGPVPSAHLLGQVPQRADWTRARTGTACPRCALALTSASPTGPACGAPGPCCSPASSGLPWGGHPGWLVPLAHASVSMPGLCRCFQVFFGVLTWTSTPRPRALLFPEGSLLLPSLSQRLGLRPAAPSRGCRPVRWEGAHRLPGVLVPFSSGAGLGRLRGSLC